MLKLKQNSHRMIEWLGLKESFKDHLVQPINLLCWAFTHSNINVKPYLELFLVVCSEA